MATEIGGIYRVFIARGFLPVRLGEYPEKIGVIMVASYIKAVVA